MYYRDPIDSWCSGRITLLGDAAHPMVPFLAAGAGQSIEDAWTLARVLARRRDDIPGALLEYEQRRLPRTTRMQAGARAVVKLVHETEQNRLRDRNGRWKGMARIDPLAETSWAGLDYNAAKAVEEPRLFSTSPACVKASNSAARGKARLRFLEIRLSP